MKKNHLLISTLFTIIAALCTSCGSSEYAGDEGQRIKLKKDNNVNYVFDESSTNKNGSMSYEIFVRSFYDSDGNGKGDLGGVAAKIPYLADLGIKTLWLMPIHKSPSYHGYDVSDYYSVNNDYGTLSDFDNMISIANQYNIDIMLDMVLNHCSIRNQYFKDSYADFLAERDGSTVENSKSDWFTWSEKSGSAKYGELYYTTYESVTDMPAFNLDSTSLRAEIDNICKFWIQDHGVKGFRLDAAYHFYNGTLASNVEFLNWLSDTCKKYDPNFYMVGEVWQGNTIVNKYFQSKCQSFFRFDAASQIVNTIKHITSGKAFLKNIINDEKELKKLNPKGYSSFFLSNHDQNRISSKLDETQNKVAASVLGLLPGTPFMYYGEEIQMVGVRTEGLKDDGSDVKRRLPMIWSKTDKTGECGFPEETRKDLNGTVQVELGVYDRLAENYSLLNHYKKVINVRNKYPFIKLGTMTSLVDDLNYVPDDEYETPGVIAYRIDAFDGSDYIIVVTNCSENNVEVTAPGEEIVDQINTSQRIPELSDGKLRLGRYSTVIMK